MNLIKYIKKKIYNRSLIKKEEKRKVVLEYLKDNSQNINSRWSYLLRNKKLLTDGEFQKWYHYLTNYEYFNSVK